MDWCNEHYVRIYTRDTTTWLRLGWHGQCVLMQLARKFDLAGVLDIGELPPWEACVLHTRAPEEIAREAIDLLLHFGVIEHVGTSLLMPNYIAANEASKSDRQRQKESRERRRARLSRDAIEASRDDTPPGDRRTDRSRIVTPAESQNDPVESRNVTEGQAASRNVTGATGFVTDPSQPVTTCHPHTSAVHTSALQRTDGDGVIGRVGKLAAAWDRSGGLSVGASDRMRIERVLPLLDRLAGEHKADPVELFTAAADRFRSDHDVKRKRLSFAVFLSQLERWADEAPPPTEAERPADIYELIARDRRVDR